MNSRIMLSTAGIAMILLGLAIGYLGLFQGAKVAYPPLVTGIGFLVVGGVFLGLAKPKP